MKFLSLCMLCECECECDLILYFGLFFQEKALHISSKELLSKKYDDFKRDSEEMLRKVLFQVSVILYVDFDTFIRFWDFDFL